MIYGSVCSGIEAATQAWHPLGWNPAFFSEIEKFPCAVLAHHYPDVPNHGDMTKFQEWPDDPIDLLVGGTPCQSFSVAGLRKGLDDPRGNLMLTFGAVAKRYRPRWIVWENVPGVLSSNKGRDFGTFLGVLAELGYGFAYRVLDAQYVRTQPFPWAVPQRRRRVFVVGYLGDWRRATAVLFDRESLLGDTPPRREAGKRVATDIAPSLVSSGRGTERIGETRGQEPVVAEVAPTLNAHFGEKLGLENQHINSGGGSLLPPVSNPLTARMHKGINTTLDEGQTLIANGGVIDVVAIQERAISENPDAGPDGVGVRADGASYTLEARQVPQAVAFAQNQRGELRVDEVAPALTIGGGKPGEGYSAIAFDCKGSQVQYASDGSHPTLRSMGHNDSHANAGGHAAVAHALRGEGFDASEDGTGRGTPIIPESQPWSVRRLTPRECERLQGFPDDFTAIPWRGKLPENCPDGPRYKALGNSMAVNVMGWIGERIRMVEGME